MQVWSNLWCKLTILEIISLNSTFHITNKWSERLLCMLINSCTNLCKLTNLFINGCTCIPHCKLRTKILCIVMVCKKNVRFRTYKDIISETEYHTQQKWTFSIYFPKREKISWIQIDVLLWLWIQNCCNLRIIYSQVCLSCKNLINFNQIWHRAAYKANYVYSNERSDPSQ